MMAPDDTSSLFAPALDARRSNRIHSSLWVRIGGVDPTARRRRGNISLTGLYVTIDEPVGSPGDLVWVSVASGDKRYSARLMARVARVVRQDDVRRGSAVIGAAFEFLPASQPGRAVLDLVRHVTRTELYAVGTIVLDHELPASVEREKGGSTSASVHTIGVDSLLLRGEDELVSGERVRITVPEPNGGTLLLFGQVANTHARASDGRPSFSSVVHFAEPPLSGATRSKDDYAASAVDNLLESVLVPARLCPTRTREETLSGQLSRVQLPSLLALVELERMTGLVTIADDRCAVRVYVRDGRVVDAERDGSSDPPHEILGDLLEWHEAEFSVVSVPVHRPDRVEMPTTALLLDLVREREERVA